MTRVVFDANVLISGVLSAKGPPGLLLDAWLRQSFILCVSPPIVAELERVLNYPHIKKRLLEDQAKQLIDGILSLAFMTRGELIVDVLKRDPTDNIYLACAIEALPSF